MMTTERIINETEIDCLKNLRVEGKKTEKRVCQRPYIRKLQ